MRWITAGLLGMCLGCQGPISDLPNAGGPTGPSGPRDNDNKPPPNTGTAQDGGAHVPTSDGGGFGELPSDSGSAWPEPAFDAGAPSNLDGGVDDGADAGDAGDAEADTGTSPDQPCSGNLSGRTFGALGQQVSPGGACASQASQRAACSGALSRGASECAEKNLLSLAFEAETQRCLDKHPALADVESECAACYLHELACALTHCLVRCLDAESDCAACRAEHCGEALESCSGLPVAVAP